MKPEKQPNRKAAADQLPLELTLPVSAGREDILVGQANRLAVDLIDGWPDWPSPVVILAGPTGSGKSHFASVWAQRSNAIVLPMTEFGSQLEELEEATPLVLEDAEAGKIPEEALFHAINRARLHGSHILITAREFPSAWQLTLPDLLSRIADVHLVELSEPDDQLIAAIMVKQFADRQVDIDLSVVTYLVHRMERSLATAGKLVDWLDREAMARKKPVTRKLAAEALEALS